MNQIKNLGFLCIKRTIKLIKTNFLVVKNIDFNSDIIRKLETFMRQDQKTSGESRLEIPSASKIRILCQGYLPKLLLALESVEIIQTSSNISY